MDDIDHKIETMIQGVLGYSEKKLRASSLREKFRGLALDEVAAIINQICIRAITRELKYLKAYSALPELIDSLFGSPPELSQLRRIAREKNYPEVMQLFLDLPPKRTAAEDWESPEDPALKDLPIGHRKSLAKTQNLALLRKLLREQHPSVIRYLLMNPRLTESDVLRVASLKPTSPAILEEVFAHPKWIARYRVKKALVLNPYCPRPSRFIY